MFTADIKTRIPPGMKEQLERAAAKRQLKISHLVREALLLYLPQMEKAAAKRTKGP